MKLEDIADDGTVFIDANVLLYARNGQSPSCRQLLSRCTRLTVNGAISGFVVAEFCHRRMMQEAQSGGRARANPAKSLAGAPETIRQMFVYADDVRALLGGELTLYDTEKSDFAVALELQRQYGLLTIDSINLAILRRLGIDGIATADKHFDNIQGLSVYKPGDLIS